MGPLMFLSEEAKLSKDIGSTFILFNDPNPILRVIIDIASCLKEHIIAVAVVISYVFFYLI